MSSTQIKELLKKRIEDADDRLLKMMHAFVEAYHESDDDAYAYDMEGNPISIAETKKEMKEGLEDVKNGNYITLEEIKKKSEQWMKRTK